MYIFDNPTTGNRIGALKYICQVYAAFRTSSTLATDLR